MFELCIGARVPFVLPTGGSRRDQLNLIEDMMRAPIIGNNNAAAVAVAATEPIGHGPTVQGPAAVTCIFVLPLHFL